MSRIDILNLEWPNSERDLNISTPVLVYLNKVFGYTVVSKNIYNGLFYLKYYKPKVLLLSNAIGAEINYIVSKYAYLSGVKVVTLTSEGNFVKGDLAQFLWGWNKEKVFYHHLQNVWSKRALELAIEEYSEFSEIGFVGGAPGFDKYKLFKQLEKTAFLKSHKELKKYKHIVGITSYGFFEHLQNEAYAKKHKINERYGDEQIKMYHKDFKVLEQIYRQLITENKDILFVIRLHPISPNVEKTEFKYCYKLPNVFVSNPSNASQRTFNNSLSITECISVSDIWIAYESTTMLEAWLLNKPTIVINPTRYDLKREQNYKGALKTNTIETLNEKIKAILNNELLEVKALASVRKQIITDTIGFDDGKNHKRIAIKINDFIKSITKQEIDTKKIPIGLTFKHVLDYKKQKSKLYQWYNPHVVQVYKQKDDENFKKIFKRYEKVITK